MNQDFFSVISTTKSGKAFESACYSAPSAAIYDVLGQIAKHYNVAFVEASKLIKSSEIEKH